MFKCSFISDCMLIINVFCYHQSDIVCLARSVFLQSLCSGSCCHNPVPVTTEMAHHVPISPHQLVVPLCQSISLHDDRCHVSHIQVSFPHWLWPWQILKWWKFNESVKEVKAQHLHEQGPKVTPHGLVLDTDAVRCPFFWRGGGYRAGGWNRVLQTIRSCWQECVKFQLSK